jgi:hypothetical protein
MIHIFSDTYDKDTGKMNHNNHNVQCISTKTRDDRKKINIFTQGGTKTGGNAAK